MINDQIHNSILLVNKPPDISSAKLLNFFKPLLLGKIGHTGTLDPFAEGLILIVRNQYTRLTPFFSIFPKEYEVQLVFGQKTDTLDITGNVLKTDFNWQNLSDQTIYSSLSKLKGTISYPAPLYSAKKIRGKHLYQYAREKINVSPPLCTSQIFDIHSIEINMPSVTFSIQCSTGTYIRSLAYLLEGALGTAITVRSLRRTAIGSAKVHDCTSELFLSGKKFLYSPACLKDFVSNENIHNLDKGEYNKLCQGDPEIRRIITHQYLGDLSYLLILQNQKEVAFAYNHLDFPMFKKARILLLSSR